MNPTDRKTFWWSILSFTIGVPLIIAVGAILNAIQGRQIDLWPGLWIPFTINIGFVVLAIRKLRLWYAKFPNWPGAWQLSLLDLLSIVFVFAISLTIFRAAQHKSFLRVGVPIAMSIGTGYGIALLFVSRMGYEGTVGKWMGAVGWLLLAALMIGVGILAQIMALSIFAFIFVR